MVSQLVAVGSLSVLYLVQAMPWSTLLSVAIWILIIRFLHRFLKSPQPNSWPASGRDRLSGLVADEGRIALVFLAAAYVLNWTVTLPAVLAYLATNLVLQVAIRAWRHRPAGYRGEMRGNYGFAQQVLVVGSGPRARRVIDSAQDSPEMGYAIQGVLDYRRTGLWRYRDVPLVGHPDELATIAARSHIDSIVIAVEPRDLPRTRRLFATAERMGVPVCLLTDVFHTRIASARPAWFNGTPALFYHASPQNRWPLLAKLITDRIVAAVAILLTTPIMLLCAVAIKLDSRGPVLFRQTRRGINGRPFTLLKFRTMCCNAEQQRDRVAHLNFMSGPVFKARNDPRVTRIGRFLRRSSLDELPQLFNVLVGDMSLVGPRPALPEEVARYEPWQHRRLSVKPGVTCLWQINGRNQIDFEHWMKLDLEYIDNWSLWLDAKILAKTVPAVMRRTGAV